MLFRLPLNYCQLCIDKINARTFITGWQRRSGHTVTLLVYALVESTDLTSIPESNLLVHHC